MTSKVPRQQKSKSSPNAAAEHSAPAKHFHSPARGDADSQPDQDLRGNPNVNAKPGLAAIEAWMMRRNQTPFDWQRKAWDAHWSGHHGLILASTGMGKTRAAWMGPLGQWIDSPLPEELWTKRRGHSPAPPLLALWITPLRALANDTCLALDECIQGLELPWTLEQRTGDTSSSAKLRQRQSPPTALVITPESLTLMLSYPESLETFKHLRTVIVDEWHELIGSKRGIQTELALARLTRIAPAVQRWGVSATIGNPEVALQALVGSKPKIGRAHV